MATTLVIRSIDPYGWQRVVPLVIIDLAYDLASAAIYSITYVCVCVVLSLSYFPFVAPLLCTQLT